MLMYMAGEGERQFYICHGYLAKWSSSSQQVPRYNMFVPVPKTETEAMEAGKGRLRWEEIWHCERIIPVLPVVCTEARQRAENKDALKCLEVTADLLTIHCSLQPFIPSSLPGSPFLFTPLIPESFVILLDFRSSFDFTWLYNLWTPSQLLPHP